MRWRPLSVVLLFSCVFLVYGCGGDDGGSDTGTVVISGPSP